MSTKSWKRIRRGLRPLYARMVLEAQMQARMPRWMKWLAALGWKAPGRAWMKRQARARVLAARKALKSTAHKVKESGAVVPQYHMRPGPPAPPKGAEA